MAYSLCRFPSSCHLSLFSKQCCHLLIFNWKHILKSFALWMYSNTQQIFILTFSASWILFLPWVSYFKCLLLFLVSTFLCKMYFVIIATQDFVNSIPVKLPSLYGYGVMCQKYWTYKISCKWVGFQRLFQKRLPNSSVQSLFVKLILKNPLVVVIHSQLTEILPQNASPHIWYFIKPNYVE